MSFSDSLSFIATVSPSDSTKKRDQISGYESKKKNDNFGSL